jgi:hypothetical protein
MNRTENYFNTVMTFITDQYLKYIMLNMHISDCHTLTVNIFLVQNAHHMTVEQPNMPSQPVGRRKLLTTL